MPSTSTLEGFTDFGNSLLKIPMSSVWAYSGSGPVPFWPTDYFTVDAIPSYLSIPDPGNCFNASGQSASCTYFEVMNDYDWDLGTSGTLLFDDLYESGGSASSTSLVLTSNKRGDGYVTLQSQLGGYGSDIVAQFNLANTSTNALCTDYNGQPQGQGVCDIAATVAYWNPNNSNSKGGFLVSWPWHEYPTLYRWTLSNGASQYNFNALSTAGSPFTGQYAGDGVGYPGGTVAITYNSTTDMSGAAIVWTSAFPNAESTSNPSVCVAGAGRGCPGYLLAYELNPSTGNLTLIWPSPMPAATAADFEPAPYAIPTAVNGAVYAPSYGLRAGFQNGTCTGYTLSGVQAYFF
jgi:hypothetical protein